MAVGVRSPSGLPVRLVAGRTVRIDPRVYGKLKRPLPSVCVGAVLVDGFARGRLAAGGSNHSPWVASRLESMQPIIFLRRGSGVSDEDVTDLRLNGWTVVQGDFVDAEVQVFYPPAPSAPALLTVDAAMEQLRATGLLPNG